MSRPAKVTVGPRGECRCVRLATTPMSWCVDCREKHLGSSDPDVAVEAWLDRSTITATPETGHEPDENGSTSAGGAS